jgi:glycine cleavage system aminomethyltransferase T
LLKRYIALAHLEARYADQGRELEMEVTVEHRRRRARCHVRPLPFYNPERKRA